jgi:serine protease Do
MECSEDEQGEEGATHVTERVKQFLNSKRYRGPAVAAVASAFFLTGLVVSTDLNWTSVALAERPATSTQEVTTVRPIPGSFANLVQQLTPTVVNIKVAKLAKVRNFPGSQLPEEPFGEFFKRFFPDMPQGRPGMPEQFQQRGTGSGVIISADGYMVTNHHVVDGAEEVVVTLADQRELKAQVVGRDPKTDLAVIKVETSEKLPVATLGDSDALQVGDWVIAIGNPFGFTHTVTAGIVSAKDRVLGAGPYDDFIQTDASINPGNSGGPLFNVRGEVVGINTAIIPQGQGMGFAIAVNTAKPLIPQLVSKGEVTRGYLGVNIQSITPELAKALALDDRKGALVAEVMPGTPAEKAGLKRGDVIVAFNNQTVNSSRDLPLMVANTPVGQETTVTVLRQGKTRQLPIIVSRLSSTEARAETTSPARPGKWGLQFQEITPEVAKQYRLKAEHGVLVAEVASGSPAAQAGIRQGDILLEVNRQPVESVNEVREVFAGADDQDTLLLLVQRGAGNLFIALEKPA